MQIYLLRHGIAEDQQPGQTDADRHLTDEGRTKTRAVANGMKRLGLTFDAIYTSPYPRASETARIVQETLGSPPVLEIAALSSGQFRLGVLQSLMEEADSDSKRLFVGHEPDLSILVRTLTGANIEMKKAALALIETHTVEPEDGLLRGLYAPHALGLLAPL